MYATYFKDKFVSFNARWSFLPYTLGLGRSHSEAGFIFLTVMRVDLGVLGAVGGAASWSWNRDKEPSTLTLHFA